MVLAVLHEQDVQLVLDLVRHDGVEVVVGRVAVGRLERARLGVGVSEAWGWSEREGSGEGQVEACWAARTLGTQPRAMAIFHTCVSTGKSCRPRQNMSTHLPRVKRTDVMGFHALRKAGDALPLGC